MGKRIVTVTLTRYYSKQTSIEVEVDDNIVDDELIDFLTDNDELDALAEQRLGEASLDADDDSWEFSDPTNHNGGHL